MQTSMKPAEPPAVTCMAACFRIDGGFFGCSSIFYFYFLQLHFQLTLFIKCIYLYLYYTANNTLFTIYSYDLTAEMPLIQILTKSRNLFFYFYRVCYHNLCSLAHTHSYLLKQLSCLPYLFKFEFRYMEVYSFTLPTVSARLHTHIKMIIFKHIIIMQAIYYIDKN